MFYPKNIHLIAKLNEVSKIDCFCALHLIILNKFAVERWRFVCILAVGFIGSRGMCLEQHCETKLCLLNSMNACCLQHFCGHVIPEDLYGLFAWQGLPTPQDIRITRHLQQNRCMLAWFLCEILTC